MPPTAITDSNARVVGIPSEPDFAATYTWPPIVIVFISGSAETKGDIGPAVMVGLHEYEDWGLSTGDSWN